VSAERLTATAALLSAGSYAIAGDHGLAIRAGIVQDDEGKDAKGDIEESAHRETEGKRTLHRVCPVLS
jgi:hypothetical protein